MSQVAQEIEFIKQVPSHTRDRLKRRAKERFIKKPPKLIHPRDRLRKMTKGDDFQITKVVPGNDVQITKVVPGGNDVQITKVVPAHQRQDREGN